MWDPDAYLRFADHRSRPFFELLARVGAQRPSLVVDLGCGPGHLTGVLGQRWPDAQVQGWDSSAEMVAAARERGVDARLGDIAAWAPDPDTDVVISNAALHWIPDHRALLTDWIGQLSAGAWIAFQVPGNFDAPSHAAIREVARREPFAAALADMPWPNPDVVDTPAGYAALCTDAGCSVDAWETTYLHELRGATPVLDWISGTALTPVRDRLTDAAWQAYRAAIIPLLAQAYPARDDGRTFFPFRRIFVAAQVN